MKFRNKIFTIVLISLLAVAVGGIAIGYVVIGTNVLEWFSSRWAIWIYTGVGIFAFIWMALELKDRISNL